MAALGNVGKGFAISPEWFALSVFDVPKAPTSVTMTAVSSFPATVVVLYWHGVPIPTTGGPGGRTLTDASGNWFFYDMDDSGLFPYYIYALGTGEDWSATVVGNVVVVTQLHAANRAVAYAYC